MLLDFDRYKELGGTLERADFAAREPHARAWLHAATLGKSSDPETLAELDGEARERFELGAVALVDAVEGIRESAAQEAAGQRLASFGNGGTSVSFAADAHKGHGAAVWAVVGPYLPASMLSTCAADWRAS